MHEPKHEQTKTENQNVWQLKLEFLLDVFQTTLGQNREKVFKETFEILSDFLRKSPQISKSILTQRGLSSVEIDTILKANSENRLTEFLLDKIDQEQKHIKTIVEEKGLPVFTDQADAGLKSLFTEHNITPKRKIPVVIDLAGPYMSILLIPHLETGFLGFYLGIFNLVFLPVKINELESGRLENITAHSYLHERFHSFSDQLEVNKSSKIKTHQDLIPRYEKSGFVQIEQIGDKEQKQSIFVLDTLNEAVTELFTRIASQKAGISVQHESRSWGIYDDYVACLLILINLLNGKKISTDAEYWSFDAQNYMETDPEIVKFLLESYTSPDGLIKMAQYIRSKTGKYVLALFDFATRRKTPLVFFDFAKSLQQHLAGKPTKPVRIPGFAAAYNIPTEEIQNTYPFLRLY